MEKVEAQQILTFLSDIQSFDAARPVHFPAAPCADVSEERQLR
jgi:hypothetical protein